MKFHPGRRSLRKCNPERSAAKSKDLRSALAVDPVRGELEHLGFRDIATERIQARVTPSVLHVPWVTLQFLLTTLLFGRRRMTKARWNNVLAPILLPFVGLPVGPIAYYIVSATQNEQSGPAGNLSEHPKLIA